MVNYNLKNRRGNNKVFIIVKKNQLTLILVGYFMHHESKEIIAEDGTSIKVYIKESGCPKWLIVTHGLGEHALRHQYLFKLFTQEFNIVMYDLRGHGQSGGKRAYVEKFHEFYQDLNTLIKFLQTEYGMKDYMLLGHSMGGLITAGFLQSHTPEGFYPSKVFLSSPAAAAGGILGPIFGNAPHLLYQALEKMPTVPLKGMLDIKKLSHDSRIYESYIKDELCSLAVHSHLFFEVLNEARNVFSKPLRAQCELYCSIGTADVLVGWKMVIEYFKEFEKNCKLNIVEGGYHELHNEIEKYRRPHLDFLIASLTGNEFKVS